METDRTSSIVRWSLLGILILFTGVIIFSHYITVSREQDSSQPLPTKYSNYVYQVSLEYPPEWQPNLEPDGYNYFKYNGADGFFSLSAITSNSGSLNSLADSEKVHYGVAPTVTTLTIDGKDARLIMPALPIDSSDTSQDQAELIVQYPKPVVISGKTYNYLVIQADTTHIKTIASSVKFIQ